MQQPTIRPNRRVRMLVTLLGSLMGALPSLFMMIAAGNSRVFTFAQRLTVESAISGGRELKLSKKTSSSVLLIGFLVETEEDKDAEEEYSSGAQFPSPRMQMRYRVLAINFDSRNCRAVGPSIFPRT